MTDSRLSQFQKQDSPMISSLDGRTIDFSAEQFIKADPPMLTSCESGSNETI
jgi:hypothetical protein